MIVFYVAIKDAIMSLIKIENILQKLRLALVALSGAALICMVLMITLDVFLRFVFNAPLPASLEMSQLFEPHVVFLPMAFALATSSHVRVSLFTQHLRGRIRKAVEIFDFSIAMIFFGLFFYWGWQHFWASFKINEIMLASIKLYWWTGKLAMPLGLLLITIECLYQMVVIISRPAAQKG
jgi:TRAP-type C4-dicarboxylate transport system permease small subunit